MKMQKGQQTARSTKFDNVRSSVLTCDIIATSMNLQGVSIIIGTKFFMLADRLVSYLHKICMVE